MASDPSLLELAGLARLNLARCLLGHLKHELSQPIGAILLTTEACSMGVNSGRIDVEQIREDLAGINRLAEQVSALLAGFRAHAGPVEAKLIAGDARVVIEDLLASIGPRPFGIEVVLELDAAVCDVRLDRSLLQVALLELLRNAGDACQGDSGEVRIRSSMRDETLTIAVHDNGTGVSGRSIEQLCAPLYTTHEGRLGMGLALAQANLAAQGGRLVLGEPLAARGACISMVLPATGTS